MNIEPIAKILLCRGYPWRRYEVNSEAGGPMRGVQLQVRNVLVTNQLEVSFEAVEGATMISGMELIRRD